MNLECGQKLGPYEIVSLVGAGGMGEVYRARDTRLDRTVALKVLPPTLTTSVARARFEREARAIAALSHPNICAIHDVGSENGTEYLVMEFLDGETLAERIARGPLPVQHVVRYGAQIAEALQQAHRAGITHRDLKPGNIMITGAGAKLLDFGLAKTVHEEGARVGHDAPTQAGPLTGEGTIVGTFQYMSPEQIEGKPLDHRTDIFALGVILYEMTTGRRPFAASSSSAIAAAILASDPVPVRSLQPQAPPSLERIITTALEKNPEDRWQTAQDVARQLRWLSESSSTATAPTASHSRRGWLWIALGLLPILAALAGWQFLRSRATSNPLVARLHLFMPSGIVAATAPDVASFALSPDGRTLCFMGVQNGERALYLRDLSEDAARKLDGTVNGTGPFWSPDGQWVGFSARGKLWKTSRAGDSPPRALCDVASGGANATWGDGFILFSDAPGGRANIFRVPAGGGAPTPLTTPAASEWRHAWPHVLPDGEHFVFQAFSATSIDRDLVLATLDGRKKSVLLKNVSAVRSSAPDELMFVREGKLLAQKFEASGGVVTGDPVTVAGTVANFFANASAEFDAALSGVVVYRTETGVRRMSLVDRAGAETKLIDDSGRFFDLDLSPDGTKVLVTLIDGGTGLGDIWLYDLARDMRDRVTTDAGMEFAPLWSHDGKGLYHSSAQGGSVPQIVRRRLDGSAAEEVTRRGRFRSAESLTPDGSMLYFVERSARTKTDLYRRSVDGKEEVLLASEFVEQDPAVSPDGAWFAFTTDSTGQREVYVQSVAVPNAPRLRVSHHGGSMPRWRDDGAELFYVGGDARTISAARTASGRWEDATSEVLFRTPSTVVDFEPQARGSSFLIIQSTPGTRDGLFHAILGWH